MKHVYNKIAGKKVERIEELADGVFSIAMTFLVFNLKLPDTDALSSDKEILFALKKLLPDFLTFFVSFITLGIFWLGQSTQFTYITKSDRNLYWIEIFFLMFITLLPFSASFLARHIESKVALVLYWLNILCMGITLYIHWIYAVKSNYVTISSPAISDAIKKRITESQTLYFLAFACCFINNYISIFLIVGIQLHYAFAFFNIRIKKE